jgi:hypothetical protein
MPDFVHVTYRQTGASQKPDGMGMRAMQARAYAERGSQYLLVKAPPASGKSRALMFIGLDKLQNQGLRSVRPNSLTTASSAIGPSMRSGISARPAVMPARLIGSRPSWTVMPRS